MSRIDEKEVMKDFERMQVDEVKRHRKTFKEIERDLYTIIRIEIKIETILDKDTTRRSKCDVEPIKEG